MNFRIVFPSGHDQIASLAPQDFLDKLAAQRSAIIAAHLAGRKDQPIARENLHGEVVRGKPLDAFDQIRRDIRAHSIDAMTGMTA